MKHTFLTSERDKRRFEQAVWRVAGWLLIVVAIIALAALPFLSKP